MPPLAGQIHHPGPRAEARRATIPVAVETVTFKLEAGESLHTVIARTVQQQQADAAFVVLASVCLTPCVYVLPSGPVSFEHVAWYSERHSLSSVEVSTATAIVGKKDGEWFVHCHAVWHAGDRVGMGHLLNQECIVETSCTATMHVVRGGTLTVARDPETHFPLFQATAVAQQHDCNAALLLIRPHEDLRATINSVVGELGMQNGRLYGIGSLEGADFNDGTRMQSPLSEIVLAASAAIADGQCQTLPIICVTPEESIFSGDLKDGGGSILITCELLLVED